MEVVAMRRMLSVAVAGIGTALVLSACGLGDVGGGGREVGVTLDEYHVKLSEPSGSSGKVTFKVHNGGHEKHEFVILKTSLDAANLNTWRRYSEARAKEKYPKLKLVADA